MSGALDALEQLENSLGTNPEDLEEPLEPDELDNESSLNEDETRVSSTGLEQIADCCPYCGQDCAPNWQFCRQCGREREEHAVGIAGESPSEEVADEDLGEYSGTHEKILALQRRVSNDFVHHLQQHHHGEEEVQQELEHVHSMDIHDKLDEIQRKVAAAKIQKATRKRQDDKRASEELEALQAVDDSMGIVPCDSSASSAGAPDEDGQDCPEEGNLEEPSVVESGIAQGESAEESVEEQPDTAEAESERDAWLPPLLDQMLSCSEDAQIPLLRVFPHRLRRKICMDAKVLRPERGQILFIENNPGDHLVVVGRGTVGLFRLPFEHEQDELEWQHRELHSELHRLRHRAADIAFSRFKSLGTRRFTPVRDIGFGQSRGARDRDHEESSSASSGGFLEDGSLDPAYIKQKRDLLGIDVTPETLIYHLAISALVVVGMRWHHLQHAENEPVCESAAPAAARYFISCRQSEQILLGQELEQQQSELDNGEGYLPLHEIGVCTDCVPAGQALGMAAPGFPGGGSERLHTAVVLSETTDLLVLDDDAVNQAMAEMVEGIPHGNIVATLLRSRGGSELSPQDILLLDSLIQKHQAFSNLECRARAELCRRMQCIRVPAGEVLFQEGAKISCFFQILSGAACIYVRECSVPGAPVYDEGEDGCPVLCVGEGFTFGEQGLLGNEEFYPQTVRAAEEMEVICISCEDYSKITQDWWGEQSMRRRSVEVLRSQAEPARPEGESELLEKLDIEALVHVLRGAGFLHDSDAEACREIVQFASLLHVPKGEFLLGFGESSSDVDGHDGKVTSITGNPKTLHIVLSGCMGRYLPQQQAGLPEELSLEAERSAILSDAPSSAPIGFGTISDEEEPAGVHRDVLHIRAAIQRLQDTVGKNPLQSSMADRVRLTHLQRKLSDIEGKMAESERLDLNRMITAEGTPISLSRSYTPTATGLSRSATTTTVGAGNPDALAFANEELIKHDHSRFPSDVGLQGGSPLSPTGNSIMEEQKSLEQDNPQDWTLCSNSIETLGVDILDVGGCHVELREGESFGGWGSLAAQGSSALNSSGGERIRAHHDTNLLVLTQANYEQALKNLSRRSLSARAAFLAKYFPAEVTSDVIHRLVPYFHQETRSMGCMVVREGSQSSTIWMILTGQCQCFTSPGSQSLTDAAALGEDAGDDTLASHKPAIANPTSVFPKADKSVIADESPVADKAPANSSGDAGQSARSGTGGRGAVRNTRAPVPPLGGASSHLGSAAEKGNALFAKGTALGILMQGQFVGLFSALFHQPEPLTVVASSAQVELLAISKNDLFSRLPNRITDALKESTRAQCDWYAHRSAHVAALPGQVVDRLEKVRSEVQQVHIPRMIDSPFLRRHGTPGLDMLDKVCTRYGALVHPESEWLFATRSPGFFQSIRLANALQPTSKWEASSPRADFGAVLEEGAGSVQSSSANRRFHRFHQLSKQMQESAADNEYITPESSNMSRLSPKSVSQLNITTTTSSDVAEELGLSEFMLPLHHRPPVPTEVEGAVPLLMPSRVHRLTSYGELAQKKKVVKKTAPKRVLISPGRVRPGADQVIYRSKAMRDKQAGLAASSKVDVSKYSDSPEFGVSLLPVSLLPGGASRRTRIETVDGGDSPVSKITQKNRSNEFFPPLIDVEAESNQEETLMRGRPSLTSPRRRTYTRSGTRGSVSLRRGTDADLVRAQAFHADETLEIASPTGRAAGTPRQFGQHSPRTPGAAPTQNRPSVWRRSRFTSENLEPLFQDKQLEFYRTTNDS